MKRNKRILILIVCQLCLLSLGAQENEIARVLAEVKRNNPLLSSYALRMEADMLRDKADNTLPAIEVETEQMFSSDRKIGRESEWLVSQAFEFPTVYLMRGKLNKQKGEMYRQQLATVRTDLLLQVKEICCDLIYLNRRKVWLEKRRGNAERLLQLYRTALEKGETTLLDLNKLELEAMNVATEIMQNQADYKAKHKELETLNGGKPIQFDATDYALTDSNLSVEALVARDSRVRLSEQELQVSQRQLALDRAHWWPELSLGYKFNKGDSEQFNGLVAGLSIPLYSNAKRVKATRKMAVATSMQSRYKRTQVRNELEDLKEQMALYSKQLAVYKRVLTDNRSLELLGKALEKGEISMLEYLVDALQVYQSTEQYLSLENEYQKLQARFYKSLL